MLHVHKHHSMQILREDLQLTLDGLFNLQLDAVNNVTSANEISATEHSKLVTSLERLHKHYGEHTCTLKNLKRVYVINMLL